MVDRPPILPPALGLLMMLGIFTAHFSRPLVVFLHYPINYIGLLPIGVGAILSVLADREFRKKGLIDANGEYRTSGNMLVTSGVYSISRNPAYLGLVLIIAGMAMWVGSLSPWLVVLFFPVLLYRSYIRAEEARLMEQFGASYRQYCQLVPRWFLYKRRLPE